MKYFLLNTPFQPSEDHFEVSTLLFDYLERKGSAHIVHEEHELNREFDLGDKRLRRATSLVTFALDQDLVHNDNLFRLFHASFLNFILYCLHFFLISMSDASMLNSHCFFLNRVSHLNLVDYNFESMLLEFHVESWADQTKFLISLSVNHA